MVARDVKVYVRGKHIYSRDYWENSLTEKSKERILPHIGFKDSDKGPYVNLSYERPLGDKDTIYADLNYYSKAGYKPVYGLEHNERNFNVTYENGWYEDDDEWVEKQNNIRFDYKNHHIAPGLPLSYSAYFERGLWKMMIPDVRAGIQNMVPSLTMTAFICSTVKNLFRFDNR